MLWYTQLQVWLIIYLKPHRIDSTFSMSMHNNLLTVMPVVVNLGV